GEGIDPEHLGDQQRDHVVAALTDLGRAAERRHAARAVEAKLDARVGEVVPVDREARAAEVARAREPEAAPRAELRAPRAPARAVDDLLDALAEADRADAEEV